MKTVIVVDGRETRISTVVGDILEPIIKIEGKTMNNKLWRISHQLYAGCTPHRKVYGNPV